MGGWLEGVFFAADTMMHAYFLACLLACLFVGARAIEVGCGSMFGVGI